MPHKETFCCHHHLLLGPPEFPVPPVLAQAQSCIPCSLNCKPAFQQLPSRTSIHNIDLSFIFGENEFKLILIQHSSHADFNLLQNFFLEIWISQCTPHRFKTAAVQANDNLASSLCSAESRSNVGVLLELQQGQNSRFCFQITCPVS